MPNEKHGRLHFLRKHKKIYLAIVILLIIVTIIFKPAKSQPIEVQKVKKGDITESLSETGTIASKTTVNLNFLGSGKLVYLGAKKGDYVQAYQTIAVLDQRTLQKNLETALRDYSLQRNDFDQTQNNNANRTPNQALNDAMKRILQDNQYDLEKAVLSVELQQLTKENSVLTSPIAGIVIGAGVQTNGVNVSSSTTFTIADPNNLVFKFDVDEADIGKIRIGEKITLVLDSYPDETLFLQITAIDFSSHTSDRCFEDAPPRRSLPERTCRPFPDPGAFPGGHSDCPAHTEPGSLLPDDRTRAEALPREKELPVLF